MGKYFDKMKQDLEIRGYSPCTVTAYLGHMKRFVKFHMKSPTLLTLQDITSYQVFLVYTRKASFSNFNQCVCAIKYFYKYILPREWRVDHIPYRKQVKRLPSVMSKEDVFRLIESAANIKYRAIIQTLYSSGLRVAELIQLKINDIDSKRMVIRVDQGKGQKDRYVMLSSTLLKTLREYWRSLPVKPKCFLFAGADVNNPFSKRSVQRIVKDTALRAGLKKTVSPHTLRHSFATHLLEDGVNIRIIQKLLGHNSLRATALYTHVAENYINQTKSPLDSMAEHNGQEV